MLDFKILMTKVLTAIKSLNTSVSSLNTAKAQAGTATLLYNSTVNPADLAGTWKSTTVTGVDGYNVLVVRLIVHNVDVQLWFSRAIGIQQNFSEYSGGTYYRGSVRVSWTGGTVDVRGLDGTAVTDIAMRQVYGLFPNT